MIRMCVCEGGANANNSGAPDWAQRHKFYIIDTILKEKLYCISSDMTGEYTDLSVVYNTSNVLTLCS